MSIRRFDAYLDRQTVLAEPPRYARVMLADELGNTDDTPELYVGVELIPERNGHEEIRQKLANKARDTGLLQQPVSGEIYKTGLDIYMRVGISTEP